MENDLPALAARMEIQDLVVRYCVAVDDRDLETICDLFTPDATFSAVGDPPRGRAEIREYYAARLERYGMTYHYPHGVTMTDLTADSAAGIVLAHADICVDEELFRVAMRYHDRYARADGRWRFAEREVRQFYALPHRELAAGVTDRLRVRWPGTTPAPAALPESLASWQRFQDERRSSRHRAS